MKRTFTALATAAVVLVAAPASFGMDRELTMLDAAVARSMQNIGLDVDTSTLTLAQLAQIKNVLDSSANADNKRARVEAIVNDGPVINEQLGMLELSIARQLDRIGVEGVVMGSLSLAQLAQIKNVLSSNDSNNGKANRVNAIIDDRPTINEELGMLELAVQKALGDLGVTGVDMTSLSLSQLARIKQVLDGNDSSSAKAEQATAIINNN